MNVKAFMPSATPTPLSEYPRPDSLQFFVRISCSFQLMHTKLVKPIAKGEVAAGWRWTALATFMAYSKLIALSFSHFMRYELLCRPPSLVRIMPKHFTIPCTEGVFALCRRL